MIWWIRGDGICQNQSVCPKGGSLTVISGRPISVIRVFMVDSNICPWSGSIRALILNGGGKGIESGDEDIQGRLGDLERKNLYLKASSKSLFWLLYTINIHWTVHWIADLFINIDSAQSVKCYTSNYNKVKVNLLWTHQRSHTHNVINLVIDKICKLSLLVSKGSMYKWSKASLLSHNCAHLSVLVCVCVFSAVLLLVLPTV